MTHLLPPQTAQRLPGGGFWRKTWAMLVKEFIQLKRDRVSFAMIIMIPLVQLMLFGYAINTNPRNTTIKTCAYIAGISGVPVRRAKPDLPASGRVNSLSPGPTDTAMFGRFPGEEQGEAVKDVLRTNNPSKRMADPLEIAKLAVYLASDDSAYVVGADFLIDGGVTAISPVGA